MNLIKHLHEMVSKDDQNNEKYDYEKIEFMQAFFDAIADVDMREDYQDVFDRWASINDHFDITRQGSTFHVAQTDMLTTILHNDMAILAKKWDFKLDYVESYKINLSEGINPALLPVSVGTLSCSLHKVKDLELLSSCKIITALYATFNSNSAINMLDMPLHLYKNIILKLSRLGDFGLGPNGKWQRLSSETIINLEPVLKILANNKIRVIWNLFPDDKNQKLHKTMNDLLDDKNINKAIDSIIDAGLEDIL